MAVSAEFMATVRVVALGVVGLACVGYAGLALMADRPDPVGWYWPATAGLLAGLVITFAALVAGPRQARAATVSSPCHPRWWRSARRSAGGPMG